MASNIVSYNASTSSSEFVEIGIYLYDLQRISVDYSENKVCYPARHTVDFHKVVDEGPADEKSNTTLVFTVEEHVAGI